MAIKTGSGPKKLTCVGAVPIYGRSADNVRDHRNVTSMLHRAWTTEHGVLVEPTMSFDEKGHRENHKIFYVLGSAGDGTVPEAFYPTVAGFLGEGGTFLHPRAIYERAEGVPAGTEIDGREAMGGIRFSTVTLAAGQSAVYIVLMGIAEEPGELERVRSALRTSEQVEEALAETKTYWQERVNVRYHTGSPDFDCWMRWVSFQPFLRRLYGCSFLPHHDYGRGGRGWRDLWQDCLSLLLMDPDGVGEMIKANFGGVRVDGTNATIIGDGVGNFIADRNGIARVWMDHALWPLMTTKLYIGRPATWTFFWKPPPTSRTPRPCGGRPRTGSGPRGTATGSGPRRGKSIRGAFWSTCSSSNEVGAHNIFRLRGADWNDALGMAAEHGESVAFTCAYAGNLLDLAGLLHQLAGKQEKAELLAELQELLESGLEVYGDISRKTEILEGYARRCIHKVSGQTVSVSLTALAENLEGKARWLMEHVRRQEWIKDGEDGWFNSYYDNHSRPLEGRGENGVRMMLTGQVFAIVSGTATQEQMGAIVRSADRYLYKKEAGGYRLNTDFRELKLDMGRMFGFAYGEKENGAVFSHMTVM